MLPTEEAGNNRKRIIISIIVLVAIGIFAGFALGYSGSTTIYSTTTTTKVQNIPSITTQIVTNEFGIANKTLTLTTATTEFTTITQKTTVASTTITSTVTTSTIPAGYIDDQDGDGV